MCPLFIGGQPAPLTLMVNVLPLHWWSVCSLYIDSQCAPFTLEVSEPPLNWCSVWCSLSLVVSVPAFQLWSVCPIIGGQGSAHHIGIHCAPLHWSSMCPHYIGCRVVPTYIGGQGANSLAITNILLLGFQSYGHPVFFIECCGLYYTILVYHLRFFSVA